MRILIANFEVFGLSNYIFGIFTKYANITPTQRRGNVGIFQHLDKISRADGQWTERADVFQLLVLGLLISCSWWFAYCVPETSRSEAIER